MASHIFFLATVIALSILSRECRADLINDVCDSSMNPSLCTLALRSDPRSKSSVLTYKLLAQIIVYKTELQGKLVMEAAKKVENDKDKELLEGCTAAMSNAVDKMDAAKGFLEKDSIVLKDVEIRVLSARAYSELCNDRIPRIPQPRTLKLYNDTFRDLIDVAYHIISKLV